MNRAPSSLSSFYALLLALAISVLAPPALAQQQPPTGCAAMLQKWRAIAVENITDWRFKEAGDFRGEDPALDDSGWEVTKRGVNWEAATVWLRKQVIVPEQRGGYSFRGARLMVYVTGSWSATEHISVFVNGSPRAQGNEIEPFALTENALPGEKFLIAVRVQQAAGKFNPVGVRVELAGVAGRTNVQTLLEECYAAERLNEAAPAHAARTQTVEAARNAIEWSALERGDQKALDDSLVAARAKLEPLRDWLKSHTVFAAGNAHIDMAWLWPWTETVEVTRNTFGSVLKLMQEFPELKFTHASARTYAWMEEKYPDLFQQVQRRVKEGRWEIVGGMWVEPDLNMPDGESLVRQLLVGKRYFKDKFGVNVRIGWNPDSFGYNWQLPQIYKRSGLDYFVTQKIAWSDTTKFPHKLFWWEAPDGSRVLTYFPNDYVNSMDALKISRDTAAAVRMTGLNEMLHLYGIGDHGGGPTRRMLEVARKWQSPLAIFPRVTHTTALEFFDTAAKKLTTVNVPIWKDELYLEYHRGVQTTQAKTKRNNRRNETLMLNAEKFSSIASLFGRAYPQQDLNEAWRLLLFNQFHDILPGSSIAPVYADASRDHAEVQRIAGDVVSDAVRAIAARANTQGPGVPVVVFNPLGWARTDVVEVEVRVSPAPDAIQVRDASGAVVVSEVIARDTATQRATLRILAQDVPPFGYKVLHVVSMRAAGARIAGAPRSSLTASGTTLQNEYVRVSVDAKTGCITSLLDKKQNREALAPGACGNSLQAFRDKPKDWDAWNIDANFEDEKWDLDKADEVKLVEMGPVRAAIRVVRTFQKSKFTQYITSYAGIPRVDIRTEADWHEDHILVKAAFPVNAKSDFATFEIPYGSIQRPTTRNTPAEKAKFEVPAIRWADLSDANGGLSLLNDSKYGHDAKGNVLRISLLRSPKWPDPNADMGAHEFTYSLYPHAGSWKDTGTVRRGYELNTPLIPVVTQAHPGALPPSHSFVQIEPENVILSAVKKAEDGDAWLLRFYEFAGKDTQVKLRLPAGAVRAWETNLMEKDEHELTVSNGELVIPTKPYQIKTVRMEFKK
jgi:alpha-mannosidase